MMSTSSKSLGTQFEETDWPRDMGSTPSNDGRTRKACLQCYQKKIRCTFEPSSKSCVRCEANDLECVPVENGQRRPRPTVKGGLEELSSRIIQLEATVYAQQRRMEAPDVANLYKPVDLLGDVQNSRSLSDPSGSSVARSYRGTTSPWSTLVNHLQTANVDPELDLLRADVSHFADDERSSTTTADILYDLCRKFPNVTEQNVMDYIKAYARDAPYPILHYESLLQTTDDLLKVRRARHWGQLVCVLMYLAFGSTMSASRQASGVEAQTQASNYLKEAWDMLPQLIVQRDLWALKGLTLIIHYLQASSKPEPCWDLLGTATRMAISLGFHQKHVKVHTYNAIEAEEGKRAWWLCFVMDKTFCTVFGYPSLIDINNNNTFNADEPTPFQAASPNDNIFGKNENSAVTFFRDIITLTRNRDNVLQTHHEHLSPEALTSLLDTILPASLPTLQYIDPVHLSLRFSITTLAHCNALNILSFRLSPLNSLPPLCLASSRTSLRIILDTNAAGTTMCLWMWLYYGFTAAVVLFVNVISHPKHEHVVLDLALLEDLRELCAKLKESEGAARVGSISERMAEVGWRVVRRASRKRGVEEGEEPAKKAARTENVAQDSLFREGASASALEDGQTEEKNANQALETAPQAFEWDQWVQWLDETPLEW